MNAKPIVRWPGGKTRLLGKIVPLMRPHKLYVEAFAGGAALMLAKDRSAAEVLNDIDGELVNLYRHAQWHLEALVTEVEWTLTSREDLEGLIAQPGLTGLQRAGRYLLRNRLSFGGGGTSFAVSKQGAPSRANVIEALRRVSERLDKVIVENLSYERLFVNYDSPATLWFLDPPYSAGRIDNYAMWSDATMREFSDRVLDLEGDWIVTVNDSPLNRDLFAKHEVTPVVTRSQARNQKVDSATTFGELIIRRRLQRACKAAAVRAQTAFKKAA